MFQTPLNLTISIIRGQYADALKAYLENNHQKAIALINAIYESKLNLPVDLNLQVSVLYIKSLIKLNSLDDAETALLNLLPQTDLMTPDMELICTPKELMLSLYQKKDLPLAQIFWLNCLEGRDDLTYFEKELSQEKMANYLNSAQKAIEAQQYPFAKYLLENIIARVESNTLISAAQKDVYLTFGQLCEKTEDNTSAQYYYQKVCEKFPKNIEAQSALKRIQQKFLLSAQQALINTNYFSAKSHFSKVLTIDPHNRPALIGLAQTEEKLGFINKAITLYNQCLELDPKDRDATQGIKKLTRPKSSPIIQESPRPSPVLFLSGHQPEPKETEPAHLRLKNKFRTLCEARNNNADFPKLVAQFHALAKELEQFIWDNRKEKFKTKYLSIQNIELAKKILRLDSPFNPYANLYLINHLPKTVDNGFEILFAIHQLPYDFPEKSLYSIFHTLTLTSDSDEMKIGKILPYFEQIFDPKPQPKSEWEYIRSQLTHDSEQLNKNLSKLKLQ